LPHCLRDFDGTYGRSHFVPILGITATEGNFCDMAVLNLVPALKQIWLLPQDAKITPMVAALKIQAGSYGFSNHLISCNISLRTNSFSLNLVSDYQQSPWCS